MRAPRFGVTPVWCTGLVRALRLGVTPAWCTGLVYQFGESSGLVRELWFNVEFRFSEREIPVWCELQFNVIPVQGAVLGLNAVFCFFFFLRLLVRPSFRSSL